MSWLPAPLQAQQRADFCGAGFPALIPQPASDAHGRYVNQPYGYSVKIPAGQQVLIAPQGAERGFVLVLSTQPRAFIRVDASYDVFYDITAAGVHQRDLNTIRLHDRLQEDVTSAARLRGEPALRSRTRFACGGDSTDLVHAAIVAVRRREIYRIDLQTTPEREAADARLFTALADSWRWEPIR